MKSSRRHKKSTNKEKPVHIKEISDEEYERMNKHAKIIIENERKVEESPKALMKVKYQPPKKTRSQELKEQKTRQLMLERKQREEKELLEIELRQQKIEKERLRIQPTLRRVKTSMSSMGSLINRDKLKSIEKNYNEWLFLKQQEHDIRQTMLARLTGDFTTFSLEKQLNLSREREKEEAEKMEQEEENKKLQNQEQSKVQPQENAELNH